MIHLVQQAALRGHLVGHAWSHPDIYTGMDYAKAKEEEDALRESILEGRLPIAEQNIEHVTHEGSSVQTIKNKSGGADLVILGFNQRDIETMGEDAFERFSGLGEILFVHGLKPLVLQ